MTRSPFEFLTQASRIFHSRGTVQSNTCVPLGTSCSVSGMRCWIRRSVSRSPSPVMLRQMGYSSAISRCICWPTPAGSRRLCSSRMFTFVDRFSSGEIGIPLIALEDDALCRRPLDAERRVVPPDASGPLRGIGPRHQVEDFSVVLERLETVRETLRRVEHLAVFGRKRHGDVPFEVRRIRPQVNDDVVDRSPDAAHQLGFLVGSGLEMHPAQSALSPVEGDVALLDVRVQPVRLKLPPAEGAGKIAPVILPPLGFDDKRPLQSCLGEDHGPPPAPEVRPRKSVEEWPAMPAPASAGSNPAGLRRAVAGCDRSVCSEALRSLPGATPPADKPRRAPARRAAHPTAA